MAEPDPGRSAMVLVVAKIFNGILSPVNACGVGRAAKKPPAMQERNERREVQDFSANETPLESLGV